MFVITAFVCCNWHFLYELASLSENLSNSHFLLSFSENLYEVLNRGNFQGLPVKIIRSVTKCVLKCLAVLNEESIIHCDIKPVSSFRFIIKERDCR